MKCLEAYFQLEIRTYRERWVEVLVQCDNTLKLEREKVLLKCNAAHILEKI